MIVLLQRVKHSQVTVNERLVGRIDTGLMALVGVEKGDDEVKADRLLQRLLGYRVFPDEQDRMNLSLTDICGGLLLVSQFTLAADTRKGMRPSFTPAAPPEEGARLFNYFVDRAKDVHGVVETGEFGADMQVSLVNDGPVTFWLQT